MTLGYLQISQTNKKSQDKRRCRRISEFVFTVKSKTNLWITNKDAIKRARLLSVTAKETFVKKQKIHLEAIWRYISDIKTQLHGAEYFLRRRQSLILPTTVSPQLIYKSPPLDSVLIQMYSIHIFISCFFNIKFNIILSPMLRCPKYSLSFRLRA